MSDNTTLDERMARWESDAERVLTEMRNEQPWTTAHFALELSRAHKAAAARIAELEAVLKAIPYIAKLEEELLDYANEVSRLTDALNKDHARIAELEAVLREERLANEEYDRAQTRIAELDAETRHVEAWKDTAAQHLRNKEYYRGLIVQIGEMLPLPDAYISNDGSAHDSVLCAKVPELVQELVARIAELEAERGNLLAELLKDIQAMREQYAPLEECEAVMLDTLQDRLERRAKGESLTHTRARPAP